MVVLSVIAHTVDFLFSEIEGVGVKYDFAFCNYVSIDKKSFVENVDVK